MKALFLSVLLTVVTGAVLASSFAETPNSLATVLSTGRGGAMLARHDSGVPTHVLT